MSMVERVAKAMAAADGGKADVGDGGIWIVFEDRTVNLEPLARAAIEAMREPTPEMLKAADNIMGGGWQNSRSDRETYGTMIDEALKESA